MQIPVRRGLPRTPGGEGWPPVDAVEVEDALAPAPLAETAASEPEPAGDRVAVALRRGLPRTPGGDPWPPADTALVDASLVPAEPASAPEPAAEPVPVPAAAPATEPAPAPQPQQPRKRPRGLGWLAAAVALFVVGVVFSRWFLGTDTGADFITRYDGKQPLPDSAPTGIPAWLGWAHFFNMFLMALVVKTGWAIRTQAKAPAYWAPRSNPRAKISLNQWMHLVLDAAWVVLGAVFYVLLFATGQWMRIVPTSWEVIPNAVSAGLQYLSLDWPNEDPWVAYNALQELMYFAVVFLAAPLAILSGLRMSPFWPKRWTGLSLKAARRIHFPVMVFFVVFVVIHVALVLLTGLRGNMNAMFAASHDAESWTGVLVFLGGLVAIAAAWFAARPMVVAPVAAKFGNVTQR
ncbi:cytochrome b/b6 domain-containing protein [Corynebacterium sp. Q4381]|uniref:cytochrome b/b6 domain-containing protein n=1 Tax=Corynebacterium sp. Marseille-Q4381 TaxID=3121597 RepID=UPI002FE68727